MIRLLVDVSLSPAWVDVFARHGWSAVHWSTIGDVKASDRTVIAWARENGYVVFTHDLDFGTVLALTRAVGPSVIQVRAHDVLPANPWLYFIGTRCFSSSDQLVTTTMLAEDVSPAGMLSLIIKKRLSSGEMSYVRPATVWPPPPKPEK